MTRLPLLLLLVLALVAAPTAAQTRRYELDPVHTRLVFFVDHAGFSQAIGTFSGLSGVLEFDPKAPGASTVSATVPIASLDLGDAKWRERTLDPTFFDVEDFPEAHFVSTAVDATRAPELRITGNLTLRGVTREVVLEARLNQRRRHPLTLRSTLGFSARTTLRRGDFGMVKWEKLVGDTVEVRIEVEAVRRREDKGDR